MTQAVPLVPAPDPFGTCVRFSGLPYLLDFNIPIRTIVIQGGHATFHAGAGIVWDSDPRGEYEETLAKARTMFESLTSPRRTPRTPDRAHPLA